MANEQQILSSAALNWLGTAVVALLMSLLGLQQHKLNKLEDQTVTREELEEREEHYEDRFNTRREAVEGRMNDMNARINQMREDFQQVERRLTDEIRSSENRLMAAFTKNYRG